MCACINSYIYQLFKLSKFSVKKMEILKGEIHYNFFNVMHIEYKV